MSRYDEPNASSLSARYMERKLARRRADIDKPRPPEPCECCGTLVRQTRFCDPCFARWRSIAGLHGVDAADEWVRNGCTPAFHVLSVRHSGTSFRCRSCSHRFRSEATSFGPEGCPNCSSCEIEHVGAP